MVLIPASTERRMASAVVAWADNPPPGAGGHLHDGAELVLRERWLGGSVGAPTVVGVDLHPVGTLPDLVPGHPDEVVVPVGFLGSFREAPFRRSLGVVAPGRNDGPGRDDKARPGNHPLFDGGFEPDVGISSPFRAQVPQCGDPGHEGPLGVDDRPGRPFRQRLQEDLIRPGCLVVGVEQQMGVPFDEAGKKGELRKVHLPGAPGNVHRALRPHGRDAITCHQNHPPLVEAGGLTVENPAGTEEDGFLWAKGSLLWDERGLRCGAGVGLLCPKGGGSAGGRSSAERKKNSDNHGQGTRSSEHGSFRDSREVRALDGKVAGIGVGRHSSRPFGFGTGPGILPEKGNPPSDLT